MGEILPGYKPSGQAAQDSRACVLHARCGLVPATQPWAAVSPVSNRPDSLQGPRRWQPLPETLNRTRDQEHQRPQATVI